MFLEFSLEFLHANKNVEVKTVHIPFKRCYGRSSQVTLKVIRYSIETGWSKVQSIHKCMVNNYHNFIVWGDNETIPANWDRCLSCGPSEFICNLFSLNFSSPYPFLEDAHLHNVKCGWFNISSMTDHISQKLV